MKTAGAVLVIAAGTMAGFCRSREDRRHIKDIEALKTLFCMMKGEMSYSRLPLREICARMSFVTESPYSDWLLLLEVELEERGERMLSEIWRKTAQESLKGTALSEKEKEELYSLGSQIGRTDALTQADLLEMYTQRLEEYRKGYTEAVGEKIKICNCLGVASGIVIAILLI